MQYILKSFFFLCCSLSFCFAGVKEDFRQELEGSVAILKSLDEKISHLEEANYKTYFGQAVKRPDQVEKAKNLFAYFQRAAKGYFEESAHWNLMHEKVSEEQILSQYSFLVFRHHLPLLKNLYDEIHRVASIEKTSAYLHDLNQCAEAANIYPKYFTLRESTYVSFLRITQNGKYGLLKQYSVQLNENDWFLIQRRQMRNILNRLSQLDLEKLLLPEIYKERLQHEIIEIQKFYMTCLRKPVYSDKIKAIRYVDLSQSLETYHPPQRDD